MTPVSPVCGEVDVARLREVAEQTEGSTPGPWTCYGDHLVWPSIKGPASNDAICGFNEDHQDAASFVATFDPPTVLALLARLEAAESARDEALAAVERVVAAMREAADELNEWDGEASVVLGGVAPGGLVHHALDAALTPSAPTEEKR
jgi:hypothetical protein